MDTSLSLAIIAQIKNDPIYTIKVQIYTWLSHLNDHVFITCPPRLYSLGLRHKTNKHFYWNKTVRMVAGGH